MQIDQISAIPIAPDSCRDGNGVTGLQGDASVPFGQESNRFIWIIFKLY